MAVHLYSVYGQLVHLHGMVDALTPQQNPHEPWLPELVQCARGIAVAFLFVAAYQIVVARELHSF